MSDTVVVDKCPLGLDWDSTQPHWVGEKVEPPVNYEEVGAWSFRLPWVKVGCVKNRQWVVRVETVKPGVSPSEWVILLDFYVRNLPLDLSALGFEELHLLSIATGICNTSCRFRLSWWVGFCGWMDNPTCQGHSCMHVNNVFKDFDW